MELVSVAKSFPGLRLLQDLLLIVCVPHGHPLGKSTLLNIVMGKLEETAGCVVRNPKLRVGHFSQHHIELLEVLLLS